MATSRLHKSIGYAASSAVGKVSFCPTGFGFHFACSCRPSQSMLNSPKTFCVAHQVVSLFLVPPCMQLWKSTLYPLSKSASISGKNQKSELAGFSTEQRICSSKQSFTMTAVAGVNQCWPLQSEPCQVLEVHLSP